MNVVWRVVVALLALAILVGTGIAWVQTHVGETVPRPTITLSSLRGMNGNEVMKWDSVSGLRGSAS